MSNFFQWTKNNETYGCTIVMKSQSNFKPSSLSEEIFCLFYIIISHLFCIHHLLSHMYWWLIFFQPTQYIDSYSSSDCHYC